MDPKESKMEQTESSERKPKTSKSRRETAVQGTNDNSIVSKCSMSTAGYFNDSFLQHFVAKTTRRAPLINRGYYLRAVCIDQVLRQFLSKYQESKKQIVSLGAGFDSAYFRLKADGLLVDTSFYEIDFPEVTKRKHAIIRANSTLSALLNFDGNKKDLVPPIELSTGDYCLLGVDLTQLNTLEAALRLCGADFDHPTLLLSECVMTYMTRRCSSALVKWAGETFQDAFFVMFEQINPDDAFGIFMQNHFHTIGSPLKCITSFPTVESQIKRFLDLSWLKCKCHDLNEIYHQSLSAQERARIETLDPFDEYEEFNLKCAHYFLLIASTASSITEFIFTAPPAEDVMPQRNPITDMVRETRFPADRSGVKRFSHSSTLVGGRYILTAGGFGEVDGRHQRVQEISITDTVTMDTSLVRCHSEDIQYSRMYHSSVVLSDGRVLLMGGRQSPFFLCSQLLVLDLQVSPDIQETYMSTPDLPVSPDTPATPDRHVSSDTLCTDTTSPVLTNHNTEVPVQAILQGEQDTIPHVFERNVEPKDNDSHSNERNYTEDGDNACVRTSSGGGVIDSNCTRNYVCDTPCPSFPQRSDSSPRTQAVGGSSGSHARNREAGLSSARPALLTDRGERSEFEGGVLVTSVLQQSGDVPCTRWRHASALVTVEGRDCVILHGGRIQTAEVLSDTYLLDVSSGVWTKVECCGDLPGSRHSHTMVRWEGSGEQQVVVVGGMDGDQKPQSSIYLLSLTSLSSVSWRRFHVSGTFLARYSHTCHMMGDRLVCVGGVNLCRHTPGIGIVNLSTGQAQEFSFPTVSRSQLLMYHRHDSVLLPDGRIVVLGGGGNCFSFGTHLNHTPVILDITHCLEATP